MILLVVYLLIAALFVVMADVEFMGRKSVVAKSILALAWPAIFVLMFILWLANDENVKFTFGGKDDSK